MNPGEVSESTNSSIVDHVMKLLPESDFKLLIPDILQPVLSLKEFYKTALVSCGELVLEKVFAVEAVQLKPEQTYEKVIEAQNVEVLEKFLAFRSKLGTKVEQFLTEKEFEESPPFDREFFEKEVRNRIENLKAFTSELDKEVNYENIKSSTSFINSFDVYENLIFSKSMAQIKVKRIKLDSDFLKFIHVKLIKFAYSNEKLVQTKKVKNEAEFEYQSRIEQIGKLLKLLNGCRYGMTYFEVSSRFYYILKCIYENFYFIKWMDKVKSLPINEILFCVSIFLQFEEDKEEFRLYKMMINKRNLMAFLNSIWEEMERQTMWPIWNGEIFQELIEFVHIEGAKDMKSWNETHPNSKISKKIVVYIKGLLKKDKKLLCYDRKQFQKESGSPNFKGLVQVFKHKNNSQFKKLRKLFTKMKQMHSVSRIVDDICRLDSLALPEDSYVEKLSCGYAIERLIQVVGECIKSTSKSPNISKKLNQKVCYLFSNRFLILTIKLRQYLSHDYPIRRFLASQHTKPFSYQMYKQLFKDFQLYIKYFIQWRSLELLKWYRHFWGTLLKLKSLEDKRSLTEFVGLQFISFQLVNIDDTENDIENLKQFNDPSKFLGERMFTNISQINKLLQPNLDNFNKEFLEFDQKFERQYQILLLLILKHSDCDNVNWQIKQALKSTKESKSKIDIMDNKELLKVMVN